MTDREKNITIAEWCGWRIVRVSHGALVHWSSKEWRGPNNEIVIPDYCGDLNAIHEAEKRLTLHQLTDYADEMDRVCVPVHICPLTHWQSVTMSTAAQRAEALLKTIGKWKE